MIKAGGKTEYEKCDFLMLKKAREAVMFVAEI